MLTAAQIEARQRAAPPSPPARRKRAPASLKLQYQQYLLERIEDYKNSLSREELLRLGDVAASDLQDGTEGQFLLTEVLMQETVDQLIMKRLGLPAYQKWRKRHTRLRAAQREPTHWNLERTDPVAVILPRLEPGDRVLVVGAGAERAAYLLAAHDANVTCLFGDNATATRLEGRLSVESLGSQCETYVVRLGHWFPPLDGPIHLAVLDAATLAQLSQESQRALVLRIQQLTAPEGAHAVVSPDPNVAPEGFLSLYFDWQRLPLPSRRRPGKHSGLRGVLLAPPRPIPSASLTQAG